MAGYNTIRGLRVKYLSADPAGAENGQVWYNSTTGKLRVDGIGIIAAWASGPAINTGRRGFNQSGVGTATAGLILGGSTDTTTVNKTEEYDGSSWTETGAYPAPVQNTQAAGIQTAAYAFGGYGPAISAAGNTYNGSTWTSGTALPAATWLGVGGGTAPTAIIAGGSTGGSPEPSINTTLEYSTGSWTAGGTLGTARRYLGGFGTQTSMAVYGGLSAGPAPASTKYSLTEEYNGSSWVAGGAFSDTVWLAGSPASTGSSAGMAINGRVGPAVAATTAVYDGTSWAADVSTATARDEMGCIGTSTTAIRAGGNPGTGVVTTTEEYSAAYLQTESITTS